MRPQRRAHREGRTQVDVFADVVHILSEKRGKLDEAMEEGHLVG